VQEETAHISSLVKSNQ